jgi:transposase
MLALHRDLDVVIGVDTHKDTHTAAAVGATGAVLEHLTVPADPAGYRQLIASGGATMRRCGPSKAPAASVPD